MKTVITFVFELVVLQKENFTSKIRGLRLDIWLTFNLLYLSFVGIYIYWYILPEHYLYRVDKPLTVTNSYLNYQQLNSMTSIHASNLIQYGLCFSQLHNNQFDVTSQSVKIIETEEF